MINANETTKSIRLNASHSRLWAQVGMDLVSPLPLTPRRNRYIITLTDYFSKWAEAAALPDKSAHGVARFIYSVSALICTALFHEI